MRASLISIHLVSLGLWLGALIFSAALAGALFAAISSPICPSCLGSWSEAKEVVACATCGALEHARCAAAHGGCALEHAGSHECRPLPPASGDAIASASSSAATGLSEWARVRIASDQVRPELRLLWRVDAVTPGLRDSRGDVPLVGSCFAQPRPAVGDALGKSFELAQGFGIACAVLALGTVLLTPPGGAFRLLRGVTLVGALVLSAVSFHAAGEVATRRLDRESFAGETAEQRDLFGRAHGISSAAGVGQMVLVLTALVLATAKRRDDAVVSPSRGAAPAAP